MLRKSAVQLIRGSVDKIPIDENCINKISCHHLLEHFQYNADIKSIQEIQRILDKNGNCVNVPIFTSNNHYLITDSDQFNFWEEEGVGIVDRSATLPGGNRSGNFARVR